MATSPSKPTVSAHNKKNKKRARGILNTQFTNHLPIQHFFNVAIKDVCLRAVGRVHGIVGEMFLVSDRELRLSWRLVRNNSATGFDFHPIQGPKKP